MKLYHSFLPDDKLLMTMISTKESTAQIQTPGKNPTEPLSIIPTVATKPKSTAKMIMHFSTMVKVLLVMTDMTEQTADAVLSSIDFFLICDSL